MSRRDREAGKTDQRPSVLSPLEAHRADLLGRGFTADQVEQMLPSDWSTLGVSLAEQEEAQERAAAFVDALYKGVTPEPLVLDGPWVRLMQRDPPVRIQVGFTPEGRLVCTGLVVGAQSGGEVTSRALRDIRLTEILNNLTPLPDPGVPDTAVRDESTGVVPIPSWMSQNVPVVRHPGPAGHTDEHFERIALLYKEALRVKPGAPIKWLSERLDKPPSTIHRWLDTATERGFLEQREKVRRGSPRERT